MCSINNLLFCGVIVIFATVTKAESDLFDAKDNQEFSQEFSFGVSTSAYQIEGAWDADGKGPSIWDEYTHNHPNRIKDNSNGDTAIESYKNFDLDLKALKDLKVDHYRFSIAWSRIYPNGDVSSRNQKGIDYYNSVINKLLANGIEPMVTMYHWDLPAELQKLGGFSNSLIVDQFLEYAEELFNAFGDRVKTWITFNEPNSICKLGYGIGINPPNIKSPGNVDYICYTNILKAHGATYRLYRSKFFEKQRGKVGISLDSMYAFSKVNNQTVVEHVTMQHMLGLMAHPIYSKIGGFPPVVVKEIQEKSLREGRTKSRLPVIDEYWKATIRGSADFFGLNYYTSRLWHRVEKPIDESSSLPKKFDIEIKVDPKWPMAKSEWLYSVPEGLEGILKFIRDEYNNVEVKITENGWSDEGNLKDEGRIQYIRSHLQLVLNAINDGCNVTSYSAWSLVDNFEWNQGYTEKFGLYAVNMKSAKKERIPKSSAHFYKKIIETRSIPREIL